MKKWINVGGTALLGIALVFAGIFLITQGLHTRGEVVQSLVDEKLNVPDPAVLLTYEGARAPEGVEVPRVLIDTSEEANAQAQVIRIHTLGITGGKTYSEMDREDPNRAVYITSITLQGALHQAHVSLEITTLVIALGAAFLGMGVYTLVVALPLVQKITA